MSKFKLLKHQLIFDMLLENLWLQCITEPDLAYVHACIDASIVILIIIPDFRLLQSLEKIKEELPSPKANQAVFKSWWETKHIVWVEELNTIIFSYRNIQSHCYENLSNQEFLKCYYNTNKLLIDCLDRNHELTPALRRKIETSILSPFSHKNGINYTGSLLVKHL